jgi:hypothetical protein
MTTDRAALAISKWIVPKLEDEISKGLREEISFSEKLRESLEDQFYKIFRNTRDEYWFKVHFQETDSQWRALQKVVSDAALGKIMVTIRHTQAENAAFLDYEIFREGQVYEQISIGKYSHEVDLPKTILEELVLNPRNCEG